jgi:hypothetical protein
MKVKVNIRDGLEESADYPDALLVYASVDIDDLFDTNSIPEEHEIDVDLDQFFEEHRQVAVIWTIDHVREIRPDLSDDQCWEVLRLCRARWGSCQAIDWEAIEKTALELYGSEPRRWRGRIDVTVENYSRDEAIEHFTGLAEHVERDAVNNTTRASFDPASLRLVEPDQDTSKEEAKP